MLQIIDLENNELFSQVSSTEFATVSGGLVQSYAFGVLAALGAGILEQPIVQSGLLALALNPLIP